MAGVPAVSKIAIRAGIPLFVTWSLLFLTFVVPRLDSTSPPFVDLTAVLSQAAYWFARSGDSVGMPFVIATVIAIFVTREDVLVGQRRKEFGIIGVFVVVCVMAGSALNEYILKEELKIPRPNVEWLAGETGSGPLGMTAQQFYQRGDEDVRSATMAKVLGEYPVPLSPAIRDHWIHATGFSFPSGHPFAAMFVATFFLLLAVTYVTTKRIWFFYALLPWALAVCYSRPILRVHTPLDVTVGGLLGLLLGVLAWWIAQKMILSGEG